MKDSVVYQIYPRSFMDSNGDGIGDLRGVTMKLDYLKDLGVDVIWLCPMFKSPQDDNGYDVSDYKDIHYEFGTMKDFDELLQEVHRRGMRLILDLVLNHTSDEHPWFLESRSSKSHPKRDWYIWRKPKDGKLPNNWESIFGGSVWKYDAHTEEYFMHLFSERQPDLNWENLEMREALYEMIRWWMDKGIDGFRIDAISHTKKEPGLIDMPNPLGLEFVDSKPKHMNVPGVLDYLSDLCEKTFSKYDVITVGEANGVSAQDASEWVSPEKKRLSMIIQFEHLGLWNKESDKQVSLLKLKTVLTRWQKSLQGVGWNALFMENHDIPRVVSQLGSPDRYWRESATAIATMYFLMQGTPFIYQGQEIGMTNTSFDGPEDFQDVYAKNHFAQRRKQGASDQEITAELAAISRDNSRTPFQWNSESQAGFTTGTPWLKVNPNYKKINFESQRQDPDSIWNFYRRLIEIRKQHPEFIHGAYDLVAENHTQIFAYTRTWKENKVFVLSNLSTEPAHLELYSLKVNQATLLLGNMLDSGSFSESLLLKPFEARVYKIS